MNPITISLPFPPSVNGLFNGGSNQQRFKSKKYKDWLLSCPRLPALHLDRVAITYRFFFPDNRVRDCQNFIKATTDYLVNSGLIVDDCWQCITGGEVLIPVGIDKQNPRVEVDIRIV